MERNSPQTDTDVKRHLQRVIDSPQFRDSPQLQSFLEYVVAEMLANRGAEITAYDIGTKALGRDEAFAPDQDPIVRVVGSNLRKRLDLYYAKEGANKPYRFYLPRGRYDPIIKPTNGAEPAHQRFRVRSILARMSKTHVALLVLALIFAALFAWERIAHHGDDAQLFGSHEKLAKQSRPAIVFHRPRINVINDVEKVRAETLISDLIDLLSKNSDISIFEIENHDNIETSNRENIFHMHIEINKQNNMEFIFVRISNIINGEIIFSIKKDIKKIHKIQILSDEIIYLIKNFKK